MKIILEEKQKPVAIKRATLTLEQLKLFHRLLCMEELKINEYLLSDQKELRRKFEEISSAKSDIRTLIQETMEELK